MDGAGPTTGNEVILSLDAEKDIEAWPIAKRDKLEDKKITLSYKEKSLEDKYMPLADKDMTRVFTGVITVGLLSVENLVVETPDNISFRLRYNDLLPELSAARIHLYSCVVLVSVYSVMRDILVRTEVEAFVDGRAYLVLSLLEEFSLEDLVAVEARVSALPL